MSAADPSADRISLLVLEDDPQARDELVRELAAHDFAVRVAATIDEALAQVAQGPVDVVLTDLRPGGQDGLELLRRLPAVSERTRAIVMSGQASAREHQLAGELGVIAVLFKPFAPDQLLQAIHKAVECETGFLGTIHGLSLIDMAQMFHLGRRSITVRLARPGEPASTLHFRRGQLVHAEHQDLRGPAALRAILAIPSGVLHTAPPAPAVPDTIDISFEHLLLESLSQLDEQQYVEDRARAAISSSADVEALRVHDDEPDEPDEPDAPDTPDAPDEFTAPASPGPNAGHEHAAPARPSTLQPALVHACRDLMTAIDGAVACAVVAIDSGDLLGHHQSPALAEPLGPTLAASAHALFAGPALAELAALDVGPAVELVREARLTAPHHHLFARVLADGRRAVVLVTRKTLNVGMAWALLRAQLARADAQLR